MSDVIIQSTVTKLKWQGATAPDLEIDLIDPTVGADGVPMNPGPSPFLVKVECEINGAGFVVVPDVPLPPTENSSRPDARYRARFRFTGSLGDSETYKFATFSDGFRLPAAPTTTTWADIEALTTTGFTLTPNDRTVRDLHATRDLTVDGNAVIHGGLTLEGPATGLVKSFNGRGGAVALQSADLNGLSGAGLTGIGTGTGGVNNTGSTTIGADTDSDGVGVLALQTRGVTRLQVNNDGTVDLPGGLSPATHVKLIGGVLNLAKYATGGDGSFGNPWTGWDTNTPWGDDTAFYGPKGHYAYTANLNLPYNRLTLYGDGTDATVFQFNGTGRALALDSAGSKRYGQVLRDFTIRGNPNCTDGLYLDGNQSITVYNVHACEGTQYAFHFRWVIDSLFVGLRGLNSTGSNTTRWLNILHTDEGAGGGGYTFQDNTFVVLRCEEALGSGAYLSYAVNVLFLGGTSEYNDDRGFYVLPSSKDCSWIGTDNEANLGPDWEIQGHSNVLDAVISTGGRSGSPASVVISGNFNQVRGGRLENLNIAAGAKFTQLYAPGYNQTGTGSFTDSGTDTQYFGQPYDIANNAYNPMMVIASARVSGNSALNQLGGANDINSNFALLQMGATGMLLADKSAVAPSFQWVENAKLTNTGAWKYVADGFASVVTLGDGEILFRVAPSGTAGGVITWTTAGKFKAGGRFELGAVPAYADNAAAIAGGLGVGAVYRIGDTLGIVH